MTAPATHSRAPVPATDQAVLDLYDDRTHDPLIDEYYASSGFLNFGYWEPTTRSAAEAGENLVERLLAMIPDRRGNILDVACGTGATTRHLLRYYAPASVMAINLSHRQLVTARRRAPGCRFARMDASRLALPDTSFDNILCVEAAFHFNTREAFFREAARVLRPGGTLVLSDALIGPAQKARRPHWHEANRVADLDDYAALLRRAGFDDVTLVDATGPCWIGGFWSIVRFMHERFWEGRITLDQKDRFLDRVYRLAGDLEHYVLAAARKARPPGPAPSGPRSAHAAPRPAPGQPRIARPEVLETVLKRDRAGSAFRVDETLQPHAGGYDAVMEWEPLVQYYGGSDFVNYGYWDETTQDARQASERLMEKLLAFLPDRTGRILDVACGKGATTRHLARHCAPARIVGVNLSFRQLQHCRRRAPDLPVAAMDAVRLAFPDRSFDTVVCVEAAFHFVTRINFLKEVRRVLKPGGRLVLSDLLLSRQGEAGRRFGTVENFVESPEAYERLCEEAGFRDVQVVDASAPCLKGAFRHLVRFSHEKLLARQINVEQLHAFVNRFYRFVPLFRYYVLASMAV